MKNKRLKWKWKKERSAKKKEERKGLRIHLWIEMCGSSTGSEKTERKELFSFSFFNLVMKTMSSFIFYYY